ncbi:DUF4245 domain-containing protein [Streptomyces sp. B1866]|uniref:DUF4245 domain-containing protein n=1 Tax=Streptomyces sp. B1866 TaxID=3075431 RepID=UPI00288D1BD9|nr:DUF4245 domain-containing protein [Streptomyces sp. B1866]MDT3397373.1 DUF4245 domain-containing protein [Streptomyces sp. B1866]
MRGRETVRDMVLSLAAIGVVAAGIYAFGIPHDDDRDNSVRTVDYRVDLDLARRAAPYPVAAPEPGGLPRGWRATSVSYRPAGGLSGAGSRAAAGSGTSWHLGFLDPDDEYVAVEQSDGQAAAFVEDVTQRAHRTSTTQRVEGRAWVRYAGDRYDALVREERGVTTVVTGTASYEGLARMAAALRTGKPAPTGGAAAAGRSGAVGGAGEG